jgi:putative endonuclease
MLRCSDNTIYTGSTTDLEQRIYDHNSGRFHGYTSSRLPVSLIWFEEFVDIRDAIVVERKLKKWSHAKKEALARGDTALLHELAKPRSAQ